MLYFAFNSMGACFKPLATQSLSDYYFGHAAGTIHSSDEHRRFVVDPTFIQFQLVSDDARAPAEILSRTEEGSVILESLRRDGFFELTPRRAFLYLESFLNGEALSLSEEEAFEFVSNPPKHHYHLVFGSNDEPATPESLNRGGLWIDMEELDSVLAA